LICGWESGRQLHGKQINESLSWAIFDRCKHRISDENYIQRRGIRFPRFLQAEQLIIGKAAERIPRIQQHSLIDRKEAAQRTL
jgi:hypothetical protein